MLAINLEWDANALAAPQSFRDGVQAAANLLDAAIFNPITVNIQVGYGEIDLGQPGYQPLSGGYSLGGSGNPIQVSYPALRDALVSNETTRSNTQEINVLPNAASLGGQSTFSISSALAKAFGALPANNAAVDGSIGFPTSFTGSGLIDTAIVEEIHAMGLLNTGGDLGLFAYTSPGTHFLPTGYQGANTSAYFSTDGGVTNLANYNVRNDDTLFLNNTNDPLNFPTATAVLTALDLTEINAIGFDVTSAPSLASPSITPIMTAPGTKATITAQNVSLAAGLAIPVLSLVKSVTVPAGDAIGYYGFYDNGSGPGHLSLNGITEASNSWVYVLPTQLTALQFVGDTVAGNDTVFVDALDYSANLFTQSSLATVTTTAASGDPPVYGIEANANLGTPDGTSGTTPYTFTVYRIGSTSQAATLSYTVAGSGTNPAPASLFQNPTGTVSLAAGASSASLTINAVGALLTSPERFTVSVSGGNGAIATPTASETIGASTGVSTTINVGIISPSSVGSPVFRFYNASNEGHFFTSSTQEVAQIQATNKALTLEGPAFNSVDPGSDTNAVAVYRFYEPGNDSHFYTDSMAELMQVQATRHDMSLEGPAFSVDPTMQAGDIAVYRLYETRSDTHLYTTSQSEIASIQATRPDITLEGPAFYVRS